MVNSIYMFGFSLDWALVNLLSEIDRFDSSWAAIEGREGAGLKMLKHVATVRSVGASNRIEGNQMSDEEIDTLLQNLDITKLSDRDSQEVVGYFEAFDLISAAFLDIDINENYLKSLHSTLLKFSDKDAWHKGGYKQQNNVVEATLPDGARYTVFKTTEAGLATESAMRELVKWYCTEAEAHVLVKIAVFVYELLSVHPFQDGNGRLSRLLTSLLLLKNGYRWVQYISFEHEIENRKNEYYQVLRNCQANRPNEDITLWLHFFLDCLKNMQKQLQRKLKDSGKEASLSVRGKLVYQLIQNRPSIQSGEISKRLAIPSSTVKAILSELVKKEVIQRHGRGRGVGYLAK